MGQELLTFMLLKLLTAISQIRDVFAEQLQLDHVGSKPGLSAFLNNVRFCCSEQCAKQL